MSATGTCSALMDEYLKLREVEFPTDIPEWFGDHKCFVEDTIASSRSETLQGALAKAKLAALIESEEPRFCDDRPMNSLCASLVANLQGLLGC
jgi:hypothetical protein